MSTEPQGYETPVCGRFAPTPSGRMHLGNVWCALVAWLAVRSCGGELVLRIEDLDTKKTPAGSVEAMLDDLTWLGFDWDRGPVFQSERFDIYQAYYDRLVEMDLTYPCFCSRADLHVSEAPHASDGTPLYTGICRNLTAEQRAKKALERNPGTRLMVPVVSDPVGLIEFSDAVYGTKQECLAKECGDFLIRRSDGIFAYQLAVTVDDALMGVNQVVRGCDLLPSCARQIYIQHLLEFKTPWYAHVPMLLASDGSHRLSKREHSADLGYMRPLFGKPEILLGRLAYLTGLKDSPEPVSARELLEGFSWDTIRAHADLGIPVPDSFFEI
ncbi:MAG: tRNA glutamyl-Q(34) synthetase GluQRS [Coriobacteriales bacterium]|nr:tRNA glutamyl-Q(34) synthetase GluQRS [Coriobacteriales bacterium]